MSEFSRKELYGTERGYDERLSQGYEAITVLEKWFMELEKYGYTIKNNILVSLSDNKEIALIHSVEKQTVSVMPLLSWY